MIDRGLKRLGVLRRSISVLLWVLLGFAIPSLAQTGSYRATVPDSLRHRLGACPFECCQYGSWTAKNDIAVYANERDTTQLVASIPTGEKFDALTGNVFMERFG